MHKKIAIVLKGYPRLSETFIAQEIGALEKRGLRVELFSLRHPTDGKRHPIHDEIRAPVRYLPEYLYREPIRVLRAWRRARRLGGYRAARRMFLNDLRRDRTPNRVRRFGQALVLAAEMRGELSHIYSHFLHTPSSVARYAAAMRAMTWSFSAHAKDIWTIPQWEKREKLADAAWGITCTAYGRDHLNGLAGTGAGDPVDLVYHGLDLSRFRPPGGPPSNADGSDPEAPVTIISVGRLVAKKGYDDLADALARLPEDLHWRFVHVGGGELGAGLTRQAEQAGIGDRTQWLGAQSQDRVIELMRNADIFALMSRITDSGDRDGLPNVLMEAQSQKLACIATRVAAIPELIADGRSGILVEARDRGAMTAGLERLIRDPALRNRLAEAGFARVHADFSHDACIASLAARFGVGARDGASGGMCAAE